MTVASWFSKMTGNAQSLNNLEDLLIEQLKDLYDAENRLIDALPKMAEAAHAPGLKKAFTDHLHETDGQARRLEQAFRHLGQDAERESCEAMQGLIAEGEEMIGLEGDPEVKDAGLIAAAQRVEHYEIAGYGCARAFARQLGLEDVARLLQDTLDEESAADAKLTDLADAVINPGATKKH
jgi:ferritin-like metal-binding protein YciE